MTCRTRVTLSCLALTLTSSAALGSVGPEAVLRKKFPKLTVDSISPSPVKGLSEVISGGNIFYFDPASGNVVFGEIWSDTGKNLTADARSKIYAAKFRLYREHLDAAVKLGSGRNEVIEIIDPDCPFCREMHGYWKTRSDVTRYVFLNPLPGLHPQATAHAGYILSAADPAKAMEEVIAGKYDAASAPVKKLNENRIRIHADISSKSGIGGTPAYYVNGTFVNGANVSAIEKIIGKGAKK